MDTAKIDEFWMARAIRLARKGLYSTHPNPRVGCVIVNQGQCIAQGFHAFAGEAHAEINALESTTIAQQSDVYVSLEPCSHTGRTGPCVDALLAVKPARVIVAMQDPNPRVAGNGIAKLKQHGIDVVVGVLEAEARELNSGFISRMERNRPYLRLKMAMSMDGRTALKNGLSQWISGPSSRQDVHRLRARSSAILSSAATVLADDPALNVRLEKDPRGDRQRHPVRVIIDSQLSLSGNEKIFNSEGDIWIYTLNPDPQRHQALIAKGASVSVLEQEKSTQLDLSALLADLARREINEIHSECGPRLAGALITQKLVDELVIYMAPHLLGNQARGVFEIGELINMEQRVDLRFKQVRQIGDDIRLTLEPENH